MRGYIKRRKYDDLEHTLTVVLRKKDVAENKILELQEQIRTIASARFAANQRSSHVHIKG